MNKLKLYTAYGRCLSFAVVVASSKKSAAFMFMELPDMFNTPPNEEDINEYAIEAGVTLATYGDI